MRVRDTEEKWREITIRESVMGQHVIMEKTYHDMRLTPQEARYLARKLESLARRVEARHK